MRLAGQAVSSRMLRGQTLSSLTLLNLTLPSLVRLSLMAIGAVACASPRMSPNLASHVGSERVHWKAAGPPQVEPVEEAAPHFVLEGKPFCFQGTNNYYLSFKSKAAALDVLEAAKDLGLPVLRTWAFLDKGSLDESIKSIHESGASGEVYFQYWDPERGAPAYNDGPSGLERLDFVLHSARERGQKLILVLTNSWRDYGGMDQYLAWYGLTDHHEFFTDERVRRAYREWVQHLILRVNSIDGVSYRDDPAIFAWELANEPRTMTFQGSDSLTGWDKRTIPRWAEEMSRSIKELDPNHMVAVGDEGFLASGGESWPYEGLFGVDSEALLEIETVDFGTYHLYPSHWGVEADWGQDWIDAHIRLARRFNKPTLLEEYGLPVLRTGKTSGPVVGGFEERQLWYRLWNDRVLRRGGSGALFWMLAGLAEPGELYPDYDKFTIYRDEPTAGLLSESAREMQHASTACRLPSSGAARRVSPFVSAEGVLNAN
jgi:mannan endo-1,4-beta-mannosidase